MIDVENSIMRKGHVKNDTSSSRNISSFDFSILILGLVVAFFTNCGRMLV